jgi:hypothetical protein
MRRDLDLVRRILLDLEGRADHPETSSGWSNLVDQGFELDAIQFHVQLMNDAGLIQADELVPGQWWPERVTWAGYEFLDAARNETLWNEARRRVERSVGSAPFEIVRELLVSMAREDVKRPRRSSRKK